MSVERRRTDSAARRSEPARIDAVLFDMDGVITKTAMAHAAAWKRLFDEFLEARAKRRGEPFEPFDIERDYRQFVDGMPRFDGVRRFLASRGIELPSGEETDGSGEETVYGLGNRKNRHFNAWLKENRVKTFPGTLAFIEALRERSIKAAVFSASRNAEAVLDNAGVSDRFDARVDGRDMAALRLPGKPDPAILNVTAARLGTTAEHTAVVEDAIAGIEAAASGSFALAIGVDRSGQAERLARAGAHLVVDDLAELDVDERRRLTVKTIGRLPSVWDRLPEIKERMAGKRLAVFLDYDGTLTPIVDDPKKADLNEAARAAVADLARKVTLAIVSGRDLADVRERVGLDFVFMAGSHGFEISGPEGWRETLEKGTTFLPELDRAETALAEGLGGIDGAQVERKRFSISVHFRRVRDERESARQGLRRSGGIAASRPACRFREDGLSAPAENRLAQGPGAELDPRAAGSRWRRRSAPLHRR